MFCRCEAILIARVDLKNCVKIYQFAENNGIERLRDCCAEMVSSRWKDFCAEDFKDMEAPFLYKMLKRFSTLSLLQHKYYNVYTFIDEASIF